MLSYQEIGNNLTYIRDKKKEKTKIDIILPNFNSFEFISETVKSVLNQSYKNWKLIIVDDFSTDGTREILENINNPIIKIYFSFCSICLKIWCNRVYS